MYDTFYTRLKRLFASVMSQWMFITIFLLGYYWSNHILPDRIFEFFGLLQDSIQSSSEVQNTDFLKTLTSFPDFKTMATYLASLLNQVGQWGYVNLTMVFARVTRFIAVGICNIVLLYMALCIILNIFKTYKHKTDQQETVDLVVDAIVPSLDALQMEVRRLRSEIRIIRHELEQ